MQAECPKHAGLVLFVGHVLQGVVVPCIMFIVGLRQIKALFPPGWATCAADPAPEGPPPIEPAKPGASPSKAARSGDEADEQAQAAEQAGDGDGKRWKAVDEWWSSNTLAWEVRKPQTPPPGDEKYLFISRTRHPASSSTHDHPFTVLSIQSTRLASVIRKILLNNESAFDDHPEVAANDCFLKRDKLQAVRDAAISEAAKRKDSAVSEDPSPASSDEKSSKEDETCNAEEGAQDSSGRTKSIEELEAEADELGVLLDWIDEHYKSTRSTLARMLPAEQISFRLLWYLFHPGVRAVTVHEGTSEKTGFHISSTEYITRQERTAFVIFGERLIWNGTHWKHQTISVKLGEFTGTLDICRLACQPLTDEMEATFVRRGRLARQYAGIHYLHYEGVMSQVFHSPEGTKIVKLRAEGRAMIDVKSFRRVNPNRDTIGEVTAANSLSRFRHRMLLDDIDLHFRQEADQNCSPVESIKDEDLWMLPPTLHGFSFPLKEWGEMLVDQFTDIQFDENAYDYLVMDPAQKRLIMGLVEATRTSTRKELMQDVITNKGQGVILCLHGSAGSGKSLTAESCAEKLRRPLYLIGASELGTSAESVEKNLRDALDLATCWDAVMLIDEADVYLEARGAHELHRNALVSVFLRVLDYSTSILFLTTNRVQNFDSAFISRFSVAIKYPDLDRKSRLAVWGRFLERAGITVTPKVLTNGIVHQVDSSQSSGNAGTSGQGASSISHKQLVDLADKPMNGRSIRNAVRTAQSIALSNGEPVGFEHIMMVIKVSESFTKDMENPDQGIYSARGEHWADQSPLYR